MTEREFAVDVVRRLRAAGARRLWAGGCVRDELLGLDPADYDVATSATPSRSSPAVPPHRRRRHELRRRRGPRPAARPRRRAAQGPGRHVPLRRRLLRRPPPRRGRASRRPQRTPSAATSPSTACSSTRVDGRVIDYVGGRADLRRQGPPGHRRPGGTLPEDKLRHAPGRADGDALRPGRRAGHGRRDPGDGRRRSASSAPSGSPTNCGSCSSHPRRARGLRLMRRPRPGRGRAAGSCCQMKGLPQGPPAAPTGDLWDHVLAVMEVLAGPTWPAAGPVSFPLAFAALLHDVGKPRTVGRTPERYTFHGHEHVGKKLAAEVGPAAQIVQRRARPGRLAGREAPVPVRRPGRCGRAS